MYTITLVDLYSGEANPRAKDIQFHKETVRIGRSGDNDLVLRQTNVSTKHATITLTGQGFFLEDLGSTNGTFVNKSQITAPVRIFSDDRIEIGGTVLTLSGHPALDRSTGTGMGSQLASDHFPFDTPLAPAARNENPLPHQGGGNVSLDSIMPERRSSIPPSNLFFRGQDNVSRSPHPGAPFPIEGNEDTFPLPPDEPQSKNGLMDKIESLESRLIQKKSRKAPIAPPSFPPEVGPLRDQESRPPISDKIKQLEQQVIGRRYQGEPSSTRSTPEASDFPLASQPAAPASYTSSSPKRAPFPDEPQAAPDAASHKIIVTVASLDKSQYVREFYGQSVIIGRSPECGITIGHPMVSSRHAIVEIQNGVLTIRDLASKNGTYVNQNQVRHSTTVTSKDSIMIGNVFLTVELKEEGPIRRSKPSHAEPQIALPTITQMPQKAPLKGAKAPSSQDFLETAFQFHQARKSITNLLGQLQDLSVSKHELRGVCAPLAAAARALYLARSQSSKRAQLTESADQALEQLKLAFSLISNNPAFSTADNELIRAISLVYLFSSDNLGHGDGQVLPLSGAGTGTKPLAVDIAAGNIKQVADHSEDIAEKNLMARLVLKADWENLVSVRAFSRSFAESLFFDVYRSLQVENVVDEACTNVVEHAFDRPGQGAFCVSFYSQPDSTLAITVDDMGIPFDTSRAENGELDGLGLKLMRAFAKEVHFENRGRKGKRIRMTMPMPTRLSGVFSNFKLPQYDREVIDSTTEYKIRFVRTEDAEEIPRSVFRAHGYSYYDEDLYHTDRIRNLIASGKQISVIAVTRENTAVGYMTISRATADSKIGELGHLVVAPELRGSSMPSKLITELVEKARTSQMVGITSKLATTHPYEQIALASLGSHATGVLLGHFLGEQNAGAKGAHRSKKSVRQSSLFVFLRLNQEQTRTVYLPERHAEILGIVYQCLNLSRTFAAAEPLQLPSLTSLALETRESLGIATIKVSEIGDDFVDAVKTTLTDLLRQNSYPVIYLDLPLVQPGAQHFAGVLTDFHFVYACLIPETDIGDVLRLQRVTGFEVDFSSVRIEDSLGKRLLTYVKDEYESLVAL